MKYLRIIYNDWMICGSMCTDSEVKLISLTLQSPIHNIKKIQEGTFVQQNFVENETSTLRKVVKTREETNLMVVTRKRSLSSEKTTEVLDMSKLNQVLPLSYQLIDKKVREYAEELLKEKKLLVYQLSNGLCLVCSFFYFNSFLGSFSCKIKGIHP
jgi:DNA topoisomerase IA